MTGTVSLSIECPKDDWEYIASALMDVHDRIRLGDKSGCVDFHTALIRFKVVED
jgi:hypothetical protein